MTKGSFSPVLPGLQTVWDSTSLGLFKECPRKYEYAIVQDWASARPSVHLKFGILMHSGREHYYRLRAQGVAHTLALCETLRYTAHLAGNEASGLWFPWRSDHAKKHLHSLLQSLTWYLENFRDDPSTTLILANGNPAVELSFKLPTGITAADGEEIFLSGHIDRIVEFQGQLWISDLKTTSYTLDDHYFANFSPDNQVSLYDYAGQHILGLPLRGVIIDAVQILADGCNFGRAFIHRTDSQRAEWFQEFQDWIYLATQYAEENRWPRNDKACGHYGGCPFRPVCSSPLNLRPNALQRFFVKQPWDPTKNR